ncbi:MAG: hypothetical protein ACXWV0_04180 [Flavisolibacter sp.]
MKNVLIAGSVAGVVIAGIILYMGRSVKNRRRSRVMHLNGQERNMMYSMG